MCLHVVQQTRVYALPLALLPSLLLPPVSISIPADPWQLLGGVGDDGVGGLPWEQVTPWGRGDWGILQVCCQGGALRRTFSRATALSKQPTVLSK